MLLIYMKVHSLIKSIAHAHKIFSNCLICVRRTFRYFDAMRLRLTLILTFVTVSLASASLLSGGGVPMVDNSIRFALDRCRQFLHLHSYMRPKALRQNADIRRTAEMCRHIVKLEILEEGTDTNIDDPRIS